MNTFLQWLLPASTRLREEIAARERTEAALRESEGRFRATFENAAVGIAHVAPDGRWLHVNAVLSRITGYSRAELLMNKFADITHPADLEEDWSQARRLLAGEIDSYAMEKRYIRKDGSIVWALLTVSLMRSADGQPQYFISVVDDISERKRTDESLQENELRTRLALEASGAATWVIDYEHGAAEHFDDRSCELAGLDASRPSWPAGTFCELIHPEDRPRMQRASRETHAVAGPGPIIEYRIVRDGEAIWLQGSGIVQRDANGQARRFIGVSIDISEDKRRETELRRTIQKLADADRRKDEFLATLAHELRNPLAPIGNGVQIMKLSAAADDKLRRTAEMMERQMSHLVRLVDDLLDLSRITRGKVPLREEPLPLKPVLAGALEAISGPIEAKRLQLQVRMTDEPLSVEGDHLRLTQVFSNILSNATKYTEPGGKVWLSLTREGDEAVVSVRDSGIGIPEESLESVFEMFSQLRPPGHGGEGGLGIGLALVRELVQMHGGRVEARSQGPGHGSEFIVRLPALKPAQHVGAPTVQAAVTPAPGCARRVLVVEDNPDAADSLKSLLELLGHEVRQVGDGASAIAAVQSFEPDVVFMDIGMPGMNGLEATRRIRDLPIARQPLIVALTGWGQDSDRERSHFAGVDQHLVKPIDHEALRGVLEQAQLNG